MPTRYSLPTARLFLFLCLLASSLNSFAALTDDPGLDQSWKQVTDRNGI